MSEEVWVPPNWMFRDKRPPNDDAIFEVLTRIIFQGGLNWQMIEKKWPNFREAFDNFSIESVSAFTDQDVGRLLEDKGIIRNSQKIEATIANAKMIKKISNEHGDFLSFINSLDKADNYEKVVKELKKRFSRVGPKTAFIFLYAIGEDIKREEKYM
jgi:DNA-3-methyladenine glycosylase I